MVRKVGKHVILIFDAKEPMVCFVVEEGGKQALRVQFLQPTCIKMAVIKGKIFEQTIFHKEEALSFLTHSSIFLVI